MLHRVMDHLRRWLPLIVLVGVILDLAISWVLLQQGSQSHCWDSILDQAITTKLSKAEHAHLLHEALGCTMR